MRVMSLSPRRSTSRWNAPVDSCFIIEGPDGGGKTHLAHNLEEHYGLEYRRPPAELLTSTHGPNDGLAEWWDDQLALKSTDLAHTVYDRCFYISDPIYQQAVPSRELMIPPEHLAQGIMKLWNIEPMMIFCLPPWEVQLRNVMASDRDRLLGVPVEQLLKVNNAYWACYATWAQSLFENVVKYDYTEEDAWDRLVDHLEVAV